MADPDDRPGYSFNPGPPPEASRYLANKQWLPAFSWQDVEPEEHAVAFTVAKATSIEVLSDIREELQAALDEGLPFAEFQKRLEPRLKARGWWGEGKVEDPLSGNKERSGTLGTPRRLRTIYDSNLRSARAAGQWDRIQRTKTAMPYLQYRLGPSVEHRPHHASKEFMVLPVDDPFWQTWYPPNGWGCKCWVKQITKRAAEQIGVSDSPDVPTTEWQNTRTGESKPVPVGIDPGWERNPGAVRQKTMERILNENMDNLTDEQARVAARDVATNWRAKRVMEGSAPGAVPIAVLPDEILRQIGVSTRVVQMTSSYAEKFDSRGRAITARELAVLDDALWDGVVAKQVQDGQEALIVFDRGDQPFRFVLKAIPERNEVWLTTIHRTETRRARNVGKKPGTTVLRK